MKLLCRLRASTLLYYHGFRLMSSPCVNKFSIPQHSVFLRQKPFYALPDFQKTLSRFSATRRGKVGAPPVVNIPLRCGC